MKHGNNKDNCRGDKTHRQPIGKENSDKPHRRIASFNGYFYKEDSLNWLIDLEDLFDHENIYKERKVKIALYKPSMPYVGQNECSLIDLYEVKTKFIHGHGWKSYLLSNFILWIVMNFCRIWNKIIIGQEVHT